MSPEIMEMRRLQKALPPRPSFSQLEWALSTIGRVNSLLSARLDELSRQARPTGVPASVFEALQEMRKEVLEDEAYQQRSQAEAISRLEQRHRLYDAWIQLTYDALSPSLPILATTSSSPFSVAVPPPISKVSHSQLPASELAPSASAVVGAGGSMKSASDIKGDHSPSEGSTTSATQLSSVVPPPSTAAEDDHGDTMVSTQKVPTNGIRDLTPSSWPRGEVKTRGCNWLEQETYQLVDAKKKLAEEMQACQSSVSFKSKQLRWEFVATYLASLGVYKTWQQCSYRWNRLWKPFKTIHAYESAVLSNQSSYWMLSPAERVDNRLPRNYSLKVYEVLKQNFVKDKVVQSLMAFGVVGSPISAEEAESDADTSPKEEGADACDSEGKSSGKKRRNLGWLDAMRKDPMLHRFTVAPGARLSSCMLAAWDF